MKPCKIEKALELVESLHDQYKLITSVDKATKKTPLGKLVYGLAKMFERQAAFEENLRYEARNSQRQLEIADETIAEMRATAKQVNARVLASLFHFQDLEELSRFMPQVRNLESIMESEEESDVDDDEEYADEEELVTV